GDRAEDPGPAGIVLGIDEHGGVLVEGDVRAVVAPERLAGPDHDGVDHLALLDRALRGGLLDRADDHVPHAGVAPPRAASHLYAQDLPTPPVASHPPTRPPPAPRAPPPPPTTPPPPAPHPAPPP